MLKLSPSSVLNITVVPRTIPELILMERLEGIVIQVSGRGYNILNFTFTNINSSPTTPYSISGIGINNTVSVSNE